MSNTDSEFAVFVSAYGAWKEAMRKHEQRMQRMFSGQEIYAYEELVSSCDELARLHVAWVEKSKPFVGSNEDKPFSIPTDGDQSINRGGSTD